MNKNKSIIAFIVLFIDQISKYLVQVFEIEFRLIPNILRIRYVQNTGAAFSLFRGHSSVLIIVSIVLLILVYNLMFSYKDSKLNDVAFGIVIGGILGNLIDRIFFGYVRDFIDFNIFRFPIFNIADMAIVFGVILLLLLSLKEDRHENKS